MGVLISVQELQEQLAESKPDQERPSVRILDVRWSLASPNGSEEYRQGHLPGALYADLDTQLSTISDPSQGRHPLPSEQEFQETVTAWGIDSDDLVVVYDDLNNLASARAWWLLRYSGIENVRILDGAFSAWKAAGYLVETGENTAKQPGQAQVSYGKLPVLTIDQAAEFPQRGLLLDARAAERYRGEVEPVDPKPGHIPGAVSYPTTNNLNADGTFKTAQDLKQQFESAGITAEGKIATYCGSGVNAAHQIAALAIAGIDASIYPGSWSEWSNQPDRPVATGA